MTNPPTQPFPAIVEEEIVNLYLGEDFTRQYPNWRVQLDNPVLQKATQAILQAVRQWAEEAMPEKRASHLKKCYTDQFKCLCGTDGYNQAIDQIRSTLLEALK